MHAPVCRYKPEALPRISRESGVNVIVGTSFYTDPFIPEDVKLLSAEEVNNIDHVLVTQQP